MLDAQQAIAGMVAAVEIVDSRFAEAAGVVWLGEQLAARGRWLEPGDFVITGGLTRAPALEPGHRIIASFGDGRRTVQVRRP